MAKYFSFDPDNGFREWATESGAREAAKRAFAEYRAARNLSPDWHDDVGLIRWGKLYGQAFRPGKSGEYELREFVR